MPLSSLVLMVKGDGAPPFDRIIQARPARGACFLYGLYEAEGLQKVLELNEW